MSYLVRGTAVTHCVCRVVRVKPYVVLWSRLAHCSALHRGPHCSRVGHQPRSRHELVTRTVCGQYDTALCDRAAGAALTGGSYKNPKKSTISAQLEQRVTASTGRRCAPWPLAVGTHRSHRSTLTAARRARPRPSRPRACVCAALCLCACYGCARRLVPL